MNGLRFLVKFYHLMMKNETGGKQMKKKTEGVLLQTGYVTSENMPGRWREGEDCR